MEACVSAHCWARDIQVQGHEARLIAAPYMKRLVNLRENDMAAAKAITEAAAHPTMRFVVVKAAAARFKEGREVAAAPQLGDAVSQSRSR
jgi:transposase